MKKLLLSSLLLTTTACGSLGQDWEWARQVLNGGTGPFRLATKVETGIQPNPAGRLLSIGEPVGRAQIVDDVVFYEVAGFPMMLGTRDPALPAWEIDWANEWEPRRIARSTVHVVDTEGVTRAGFENGVDVLTPTLAFETGGVYEPAILTQPDGSVRLYYATAAGIGVASAPSLDGSFTRLVSDAILPDVEGHGPAQSPAPIRMPNGEVFLYVSAGDALWLARSTDGLAFSLVDADPTTGAIDPLSLPPAAATPSDAGVPDDGGVDAGVPVTEVGFRAPTALVTRSSTGRLNVRLYFEVRRSDGTSVLAMAGSFDGIEFARFGANAYAKNNPIRPASFLRDDGITLLTFAIPRIGAGTVFTISMLGMTPSDQPLPAPAP